MAWQNNIVIPMQIDDIIAAVPDLTAWIQAKESEPGICGRGQFVEIDGNIHIIRWWKHKSDAETVIEMLRQANIPMTSAETTEIPDVE